MLTELGPLAEDGRPQDAPYPRAALTLSHPQAGWLHSYLGHCIPLWAPRSQRRVRLEGRERRVRSKAAGEAGGREEAAREAGRQWAWGQAGGREEPWRLSAWSDAPSPFSPDGPQRPWPMTGSRQSHPLLGVSGRVTGLVWLWVPRTPGVGALASEAARTAGRAPHPSAQPQSRAGRGCRGPGQRPSAFTTPTAPQPLPLLTSLRGAPSLPLPETVTEATATQGLCGC